MAPATKFRCLYAAPLKTSSKSLLLASSPFSRCLATASTNPTNLESPVKRQRTTFKDKLNAGPSFSDFVSNGANGDTALNPEDAFELRTAMVGPKGRQKQITRLPEWLKTPVPVGDNFKKIRND